MNPCRWTSALLMRRAMARARTRTRQARRREDVLPLQQDGPSIRPIAETSCCHSLDSTASRAERPTSPPAHSESGGRTADGADRYQFASEKVNMEICAEQIVTAGSMVTIFMATFCGGCTVAATQWSKGALGYLAPFLTGQHAAWGLA